ncbi:MAG: ATP-grasp domain-containing protein [Oscillospiraceae bacterium]|nr:ATP-grasp domain-containing protein [Oscillospiraceae bacterium]
MKIIVLAGGLCPERDVSISSGSLIANALIENGHEVFLLDLYEGAKIRRPMEDIFVSANSNKRYSYLVPENEPDLVALKAKVDNGDALIGKNVIELCQYADIVFIALHGDIGENGKLQAIFDAHGVKYTGTGYVGSLLAMDKDLSKQIVRSNGILTSDWILLKTSMEGSGEPSNSVGGTAAKCAASDSGSKCCVATISTATGSSSVGSRAELICTMSGGKGSLIGEFAQCVSDAVDSIGFPCVVKPMSCGSSVGVSIVRNEKELYDAIAIAKKYEDTLIVEKYIKGREFSVGVLANKPLPPIEIIPKGGFYDYANKYQKGWADEICPARLSDDVTLEIQSVALRIHNILRLGDYSRIDFIMDNRESAFFLEANTLPGMTPTSLLPQEAAAYGVPYNELCEKIVRIALVT